MHPNNPHRISLAQLPTPLQRLCRVSDQLDGPCIWVKRDDLTGSVLTGNKVRKLEYLLADAQSQGAQVLITCGGVQSNHCRATALVAAQAGLQSHLILRGDAPAQEDANLLLDRLAGASVSFYSAPDYQARLPSIFVEWEQHFALQGLKAYAIPTGGSNAVGLWGYLNAARELDEQFDQLGIQPEYVVCATGSGGTQAGLALGFALARPSVQVLAFAVCDSAAYFAKKVRSDIESWGRRYARSTMPTGAVAVQTCDDYIGPGYAQAEPEVFDTIAWLARTEGLVLDPVYTGKAFHGLVQEIRKGRFAGVKDIVFLHTGGIFGLFPYRDRFHWP